MRYYIALIRPLLFVVACAVIFATAAAIPPRTPLSTAAIAATGTLILTGIVDSRLIRPSPRSVYRFAAGVVGGFALTIVWALIATRTLATRETSLTSIVLFLLLATREEFAYRGDPLMRLHSRLGYWPAQFIIAILFGLEHRIAGWTWITALGGAAFGSLMFGAVALKTRGLAAPVGLHAAWNIGQSIFGPASATALSTVAFAVLCVLTVFVVNYSLQDAEVRTDHDRGGRP